MPAYYRARKQAVQKLAIDNDLPPSPAAIAQRARLSVRTVNRMLAGHPVSAETMAAMVSAFGAGAHEVFEIVDDDAEGAPGPVPALRAVRS
jgi:hypothetical protein